MFTILHILLKNSDGTNPGLYLTVIVLFLSETELRQKKNCDKLSNIFNVDSKELACYMAGGVASVRPTDYYYVTS